MHTKKYDSAILFVLMLISSSNLCLSQVNIVFITYEITKETENLTTSLSTSESTTSFSATILKETDMTTRLGTTNDPTTSLSVTNTTTSRLSSVNSSISNNPEFTKIETTPTDSMVLSTSTTSFVSQFVFNSTPQTATIRSSTAFSVFDQSITAINTTKPIDISTIDQSLSPFTTKTIITSVKYVNLTETDYLEWTGFMFAHRIIIAILSACIALTVIALIISILYLNCKIPKLAHF